MAAKSIRLTAVIHREGKWFVSLCPELDVASQGKTVEQAIGNLKEAVELYLEDADAQVPREAPMVTTIEVRHGKASRALRA